MNPKAIFLLTVYVFIASYAFGQRVALSNKERKQKNILFSMCSYVKKKELDKLDQEKLFRKYVAYYSLPEDTAANINPKRREMFSRLLKGLDQTLDTINIKDFEATPWNMYSYFQNLPRMLWQSEPLTHLFGKSLPANNRTETVAEGKKELERTWVVFRKDMPHVPRYYILFNEQDKIVSWFLLNQGGLHYFLPF
jgi:hypothetical protein